MSIYFISFGAESGESEPVELSLDSRVYMWLHDVACEL